MRSKFAATLWAGAAVALVYFQFANPSLTQTERLLHYSGGYVVVLLALAGSVFLGTER